MHAYQTLLGRFHVAASSKCQLPIYWTTSKIRDPSPNAVAQRVATNNTKMMFSASDGCLQYFTGVSGQILSFNYNGASGLQLSNTDYSACIRMERNFCGIQYNACPDNGNQYSLIGLNVKRKHDWNFGKKIYSPKCNSTCSGIRDQGIGTQNFSRSCTVLRM